MIVFESPLSVPGSTSTGNFAQFTAASAATKVALAEGQELVRAALKALLSRTPFVIVGEAKDGLETIELVHREKPDVLLLNMQIPRLHGTEVLRQLGDQTHTKCVVLCPSLDEWKLAEAIKAGAKALLTLDCSPDEIESAIRTVAGGEEYLQESLQKKALSLALRRGTRSGMDNITNREHMVLELAAQGLTSNEIAQRLFISRRTAEAHRANLMRKLRLKTQTDLVLYAVRTGIISP